MSQIFVAFSEYLNFTSLYCLNFERIPLIVRYLFIFNFVTMIVWQDGLALSWILLQTLYISLSQGTKLFSLKALLFLSGFKGTGNWLPFLSQARNTRCIKNDNSIQKYMSNWITHKNPNLTVHTLISLISVEVGINMEGCKSCQITKRGGWNKRGGWDFLEKTST